MLHQLRRSTGGGIEEIHRWLMMPAKEIFDLAAEEARIAERAIRNAERERSEAQAKLNIAHGAIRRFDTYRPKIDEDYRCPWCWIRENHISVLKPIESATSADLFDCRVCHREYTKPQ
jgi:hypothetical protein